MVFGRTPAVRGQADYKACARKQKEKLIPGPAAKKKGRKKGAPAVLCPLCRAETRVVPGSRYEGDIFD